jgi:cardiolipin synthase
MSFTNFLETFWLDITAWVLFAEFVITAVTLLAVLHTKREPMSAIAWSLTVLLIPFLGALLFVIFGYQTVHRRLLRHKKRNKEYQSLTVREVAESALVPEPWQVLAKLAARENGFPVTAGNAVSLYHEGATAFDAMIAAIESAKHHVHIQFFIYRPDEAGQRILNALCACAKRNVQVRFLVDSVGSYNLSSRLLKPLKLAGGEVAAFMPILSPVHRSRMNLRNHRKILVVDGETGFSGGLNIGDEYLGKHPKFGYWRDTHFRIRGPAVDGLQYTFLEDWFFTTGRTVKGRDYFFRGDTPSGTTLAQVVASGPDREFKAIRETYVAAVLRAKKRVWIASPYFVPDAGLRDALLLAGRSGIDVRFLGLHRPDKWLPFLAARYYWADMLAGDVKVYQYTRGMMHAKYLLVDGEWASVGTANMDNRSLLLNFECNCQFFDPAIVAELEREFLADLEWSIRLNPETYATRPLLSRVAENASRLFSPVL